jgi:hypothetical protein
VTVREAESVRGDRERDRERETELQYVIRVPSPPVNDSSHMLIWRITSTGKRMGILGPVD